MTMMYDDANADNEHSDADDDNDDDVVNEKDKTYIIHCHIWINL